MSTYTKYWFALTGLKHHLEGNKTKSGDLQLTVGKYTVTIPKSNVQEVVTWLSRVYPRSIGNVTYLGLEATLPISSSERDSGPGSISPRGELE